MILNILGIILIVMATIQLIFILRIHDHWQRAIETIAHVKLLEETIQTRLDNITEFYKDLVKQKGGKNA
jgi:hypothetical protein